MIFSPLDAPLDANTIQQSIILVSNPLLSQYYRSASTSGQAYSTPLHIISNKSSVEFARKLLELGADASAQAQHGKTPLHCASGRGDIRVACVDVRAQSKD